MKITSYLICFLVLSVLFVIITPAGASTYPSDGTINWKGQNWEIIRDNTGNNVWVDNQNRMHLMIEKYQNVWHSSTVSTKNKYLYGTFTWTVASPVYTYDKNSVVGLFTYADNSHELDIEITRWQQEKNKQLWYTVQPHQKDDQQRSYLISPSVDGTNTKYRLEWKPNYVRFTSWAADGSVLEDYTYTDVAGIPKLPQYVVMNFWFKAPPANGNNMELIISDFTATDTQ